MRLRRSDCSRAGLRRRRAGRGFVYVAPDGERLEDEETLARIRALAIPPAWEEVWICPDPRGHLQATGIDAAGRKQYLYHEAWRARRDREKFARMLRFGARLPRLRRAIDARLREEGPPERERVLAATARLLDLGLFRVGGEEYAENGGGLGLATLHREHVRLRGSSMTFDYPAKSGVRRVHTIEDPATARVVAALRRRRGGEPSLLAYRDGRRWVSVHSDDINHYLKEHIGEEFSAKDFRTWNATVLAAAALAAREHERLTTAARRRMIDGAVREVAAALGNTPAVARGSYIDPRVFDRFRAGATIAPTLAAAGNGRLDERARRALERAVLDLLD